MKRQTQSVTHILPHIVEVPDTGNTENEVEGRVNLERANAQECPELKHTFLEWNEKP